MHTGARPFSRRLASAVALSTAGAVLVVGCSSGASTSQSKPSASTTTSASGAAEAGASATPSPVPTVEPPPAAPTPVKGAAGQRAFARHVIDLWGFALRTNDVKPLVALGRGKPCGGCPALQRELAQRADQGWSVDIAPVPVRRIKLSRQGSGQGSVQLARATVDIPQSDSYNTDGTYRNTSPAHPGARFDVQMRFTGGRYRLLAFTVS